MGLLTFTRNNADSAINTSDWKEFSITELFNVVLSAGDNQAKLLDDGDIPLVSSGKNTGNGICKWIKEGDGKSELFDANLITVDMFGKAYYQDTAFYAVSHGRVNILMPLFELNRNIGLFICSVLDKRLVEIYSLMVKCVIRAN